MKSILALSLIGLSWQAHGWGRIGHDLAARVGARITAEAIQDGKSKEKVQFLITNTWDLGFYCNVPDRVWKGPATYERERYNHFMDSESFDQAFKAAVAEKRISATEDPLALDRAAFEAKFPEIPLKAGRSFWRIRELEKRLEALSAQLKETGLTTEERHRLQGQWLVTAGVMGHYITDLSQPMHVSDNYDGQLTDQKGIHSFYEDTMVEELWPKIDPLVMKEARVLWKAQGKTLSKKSTIKLLEDYAKSSHGQLPELLRLDKKHSRNQLKKTAKVFEKMIVKHLALGAVMSAAIWSRYLDWTPDNVRFFTFVGSPEFIEPETGPEPKSPAK